MYLNKLSDFFRVMHDVNFTYVVLRNWQKLPEDVEYGEHSDLDLLVYDLDHFLELFPFLIRCYPSPRVRFQLKLNKGSIFIDARTVGDGYYPRGLSADILNTREWNHKGFYTPSRDLHITSLAYHVCHHKGINKYPEILGNSTVLDLLDVLKESGVGYSLPSDKSVGTYNAYFSGATSDIEKQGDGYKKSQKSFHDYSLIDNERRILKLLTGCNGYPQVIDPEEDELIIEDCGEPIQSTNLPLNWKEQIKNIIEGLRVKEICHNDIKIDNLMVKDGVIKLIDFGWASLKQEDISHFPSCLGYPNRGPNGPDDNYAWKAVIAQIKQMELECQKN